MQHNCMYNVSHRQLAQIFDGLIHRYNVLFTQWRIVPFHLFAGLYYRDNVVFGHRHIVPL